ncbi:YueI family protein [Pontibacillus marinus]|uniref:DUF1694 domain-containing protein n=1 Tax=Pontibacillus marinus BH030004 = DSM 16465 TaxID=1385511 RepID=A0A0A5FU14_9BACI|nr:YueI family protein [Pontibacillus marinus]KGX83404.1 hypothetical protein N783_03825 [Pontibacillus marinus BH030004 = DSM 16465]
MGKRSVDDVLQEGIHGKKQIKASERKRFLGTFRERVVIALTKGQLMQDEALFQLEQAMKNHPDTKLLLNGNVSPRFMNSEQDLASKYNIPYTVVSNREAETDIGAVLTYDHAVNIEDIFVPELHDNQEQSKENHTNPIVKAIKKLFKPR